MNLQSLIPVRREKTNLWARGFEPLASLQREVERLFDDFSRGVGNFPSADLTPRMDVTETDKGSS